MAKPAGAACNLGCRYCFYLGKGALYPQPRPRMADGLLEAYIRQMLGGRAGQEVPFAWQGGEPTLMGVAFYERAVELQRRLAPPGATVQNVIQTNGTLLDEEWSSFLKEHDFLVGVSLDGPREIHDAYRTDRAGRGTFDAVLRGVQILQRHGVALNILTTVHAANGDRGLEVYRFLRDDVGATWMQFIPIVERGSGDSVTDRSVAPDQFGRFLCAVFDEWVRRDVGRIVVQEIEVPFAHASGQPPALCVHAPTCGQNVALEHNGDVYSCDHFVDRDHLLGNIQETLLPELVGLERQVAFGQAKLTDLPSRCRNCDVGAICWGGCPKDRFVRSPDGEPPRNYLCPSYELFFRHVGTTIDRMASLVRRGLPTSAIMPTLAMEDARSSPYAGVGRNDPCPCGSGEKYKKCHGRGPQRT